MQFFLATRLIGRTEYVVEDALIQTTLSEPCPQPRDAMRNKPLPLRAKINLGLFDGKPSLLRAASELQTTLDETGLSQDGDMIYQLNFMFCDRVTTDQITCISEIIRLATQRQSQGMPSA